MAVNELLKFACSHNANVVKYANWLAQNTKETGFVSGIAKSDEINRVLAQGALAGFCLGQLIVDQLQRDAKIENGTFFEDFKQALATFVPSNIKDGSLVFSKIDSAALATIDEAKAAVTNQKILTPLMAKHEILALMDLILPVGSFVMMDAEPDENYYCIATGGAYSRTKYARLFKKWGTKYGVGDGSTTFNVANVNGRVLQGAASLSDVGKYLEAQLPNITGEMYDLVLSGGDRCGGVGAISISKTAKERPNAQGTELFGISNVQVDASKSNRMYSGKNLQVPALQLLACIRC